ncbi:putative glycosyltransferase [Acidovorax sp. CF316]|nr:putative glycosyltransferase [Acidovorax sp. CF316]
MHNMHPSEAEIIPYHASPVPPAPGGVLVLAPHPDDEVFGCAGAIAGHLQAGHSVQVVLLTAGSHGEQGEAGQGYAETRLSESAEAARVLGLPPPQCWGLPDREISYGEALVGRITQAIAETGADAVYAPSPWELHPDHRATALCALEAVRRLEGVSLHLYEVSAPLRPNRLLDITPAWSLKQQAMQVFASQEKKLPYASFISALNRFRALTLFPAAEYAEAFESYTSADLRAGGPLLIEGEKQRLLGRGVAVLPQDMPLVSVIVRTMGRPTLAKALGSVALQTYPHLDIVLVDAAGDGLPGTQWAGGPVPVSLVSQGKKLNRALAANAGMAAATGEYLIFLDDDDWFYPDHIAKLVLAVRQSTTVKAVHTAVECVDAKSEPVGEIFQFPYASGELRYGNFMPIHSVLFHRSLVQAGGAAFDERFDLYEDWDFWLQVEGRTPFEFVPGVSAAYRIHAGAGEGVQADRQRAADATAQLYAKWQVLQSKQTFEELVTRSLSRRSVLSQLAERGKDVKRLTQDLMDQQQRAMDAMQAADKARQDAHHLGEAHDLACAARDVVQQERDATIVELHAVVRERDLAHQHGANVLSLYTDAQVHIGSLEASAAALGAEIALARNHAHNLQTMLDGTQHQLRLVTGSRSWKITRPLRLVVRLPRYARSVVAAYSVARSRGVGLPHLVKRTVSVLRTQGVQGVRQRLRRMLHGSGHGAEALDTGASVPDAVPGAAPRSYTDWVAKYDTMDPVKLSRLVAEAAELPRKALVSIIMPVYNPDPQDVGRAIASVKNQVYPHWELCICDDASTKAGTRALLEAAAAEEPRIRLAFHEKNRHISAATNTAIALAKGQYIALLDHDDELTPHALLRAMQAFARNPQGKVLYSDEDKIDQTGRRFDPYFKPDFNLGLLRSHNYMCHFAVYDAHFMRELGGPRVGFEGAQDYDLALRAIDSVDATAVLHVPQILYHWRTATGSTASGHGNKSYAFEAGRRALQEHLQRRGLQGEVLEATEASGMYRVRWGIPANPPLVSIVIPTRNGEKILRQCLDSLVQTRYPNYEIIVMDNGSDEAASLQLLAERTASGQIRVLRDDGPFNFSAINNRAVHEATRGEFVLLMNNDIEATHPDWLDEMVGPALEPGVGCVGARLWYPDGRIQHAGVVLVCGVAGHAHKLLARGQHGYMGRAVLAQDFVAVTAACLLLRKSIYEEVSGLDETLAVAFNDVDFCLRVREAGYRNHWTPYAELIHHESVSRGYEDTPEKQKRFNSEVKILQTRWPVLLANDPCYNPNLTIDAEDFSLAWPPRVV